MKILPLPVALPGKCIVCGASDNTDGRVYIDFGFEIDFYGVVYFCSHCMSETAMAIGYISPPVVKNIEEDHKELVDKFEMLGAENVKLRVALSQLDFLGSHGAVVDSYSVVKESDEPKGSDNPEPIKPSDEPGRTNVPKTRVVKSELDIDDF